MQHTEINKSALIQIVPFTTYVVFGNLLILYIALIPQL